MHSPETKTGPALPIRISSRFGKMRTRTSRSSKKFKGSTADCNNHTFEKDLTRSCIDGGRAIRKSLRARSLLDDLLEPDFWPVTDFGRLFACILRALCA